MPTRRRARPCRASSARAKTEEIVFVRGTTEAINLVAHTWGGKHMRPGRRDRHHAPGTPRQHRSVAAAGQENGAVLQGRAGDDAGKLLLEEYEKLLGPRTSWLRRPRSPTRWARSRRCEMIAQLGHRYGARVLIEGRSRCRTCRRRRRARRRLLRVLRAQDVRPHRNRRAVRQGGGAGRDAAVAGRRQHDRRRHAGAVALKGCRTSSRRGPATSPTPSG